MGGDIRFMAHIAQESGKNFYDGVSGHIDECIRQGLYTEVQYQTTMQPNGIALFSAIVLGRIKEAE